MPIIAGSGGVVVTLGTAGLAAEVSVTLGTAGLAAEVSVPLALVGAGVTAHGWSTMMNGDKNFKVTDENGRVEARGRNRIPDTGMPNKVEKNSSGTTYKKIGPNGIVQKEYNKAHTGKNTPKKEQADHIHDHKPKPNRHPNDPQLTDRKPGRAPKKNELLKDFGIKP